MNRKPTLSRTGFAGLILTVLLCATALGGPFLAPHDPVKTDLTHRLQPPDRDYFLGTDALGRCVLSRLLWGTRLSLGIGLLALSLAWGSGIILGLFSVLAGRRLQTPIKVLIDTALAFPGLVLALMMAGVLGPSASSLIIGLAISGWAWWSRLVRALLLTAQAREFVLSGRLAGVRGMRLFYYYLWPQIWPPLLIAASLRTGWIILAVSGLSYLGLGAQPPAPEWGIMLKESRLYLTRAPWLMVAPGAAITLTVLSFILLAEGLRHTFQVRKAVAL